MSDLTAALDQFAAIVVEDEVVEALNEFTRAADLILYALDCLAALAPGEPVRPDPVRAAAAKALAQFDAMEFYEAQVVGDALEPLRAALSPAEPVQEQCGALSPESQVPCRLPKGHNYAHEAVRGPYALASWGEPQRARTERGESR